MASLNLNIAEIAALIGDPARTNILAALMDGRALTATELAYVARVSPQTASGHLAKLAIAEHSGDGEARPAPLLPPGLAAGRPDAGKHHGGGRGADHAAAAAPIRLDDEMRLARTCYDHVAGRLGVALADTLLGRGHVAFLEDGGEVTESGFAFLSGLGVALDDCQRTRRVFCRPCLDWSERRPHIAGRVGARLCERYLELGWVRRLESSRALEITSKGRQGLIEWFGIDLSHAGASTDLVASS